MIYNWFEGWCQQGWWEVDGPTEEGYCLSVLGEPGEFTPSYILIWYFAWLYMYHIARNFCGRNFHKLVSIRFLRRKLLQIPRWCLQKTSHPKILQRKLSQIATRPWNLCKFSSSKVSRYTVVNTNFLLLDRHCSSRNKVGLNSVCKYNNYVHLQYRLVTGTILVECIPHDDNTFTDPACTCEEGLTLETRNKCEYSVCYCDETYCWPEHLLTGPQLTGNLVPYSVACQFFMSMCEHTVNHICRLHSDVPPLITTRPALCQGDGV